MGSTNFTEHYDIPLPLGSDKTTPMDYNTSMQAVDAALFTAQGDASDAKTGLSTTNQNVAQNTQDISALTGRVTSAEGTISSQGTAITNLGLKVDGVKQDAQDMICAYNQASATASRNYAVGDYFIYNDVLYRATQAINSGATIVPDTNCTTTNVTSEIKNSAPDLSGYQTKQDNALQTTSKQVVGAINELKSDLAGKVNTNDIVDNLTSTSANKPLSANQGRVLGSTENVNVSGVTSPNGIIVQKRNKMVMVTVNLSGVSTGLNWVTIGNIASGGRPSENTGDVRAVISDSGCSNYGTLIIKTNGDVIVFIPSANPNFHENYTVTYLVN